MSKILEIQPLGFPWATQDPFLFCAYHSDAYPKGNDVMGPETSLAGRSLGSDFDENNKWRMYHGQTVPGFPHHPHRGFETITIGTKGLIDHADSLGAAGRFGNGDVQWMTAGKGVQHSEMFPLLNQEDDNPFELFQIWLNLPKASKMVDAHFSMIWSEDVPVLRVTDEGGKNTAVRIIAGELGGLTPPNPTPNSWAADPSNEVAVWTIKMDAGAQWTMPAAKAAVNRSLYFYSGNNLIIEGEDLKSKHSIKVDSSQSIALQSGNTDSYILVLQGKPINEPVAQYGPFVMNTQNEIMEAMNDYQRTQFGGWPWPRPDQVHDRSRGRFALYADGREEVPE